MINYQIGGFRSFPIFLVVSMCIMISGCWSKRELGSVKITEDKGLAISNKETQKVDTQRVNQCEYNRETFIDSLKTGFSVITADGFFYDVEIDTAPEILQRVFPDVVFTRFYTPNVPNFTRGTVYYENKPYNISINFNVLYHKMSFIEPPSFEERLEAAIVLINGFNPTITIISIKEEIPKINVHGRAFNYSITALVNNTQEEYLLIFERDQILYLLKQSENYPISFVPSVQSF